jgi:hypothetical protein
MRFAIALIALTACATNDSDPPTNQNMNTLIVPQEGTWHYADVTPISSNCAAGDDGIAGNFAIASPSAAGFTVIDGDTDPFNCALSGGSFNCPNRAWYTEDLRPQYDAVLVAHATAQGTFSSATRATGTQEATVTCTGSACALAGSWPCNFKVSFEVRAN